MNAALLVIDIQNDYFSGGKYELYQPVEAANNARAAIDYFREKKYPVYYAQHIFASDDAPFFQPSDQVGTKIHDTVYPLAGEKVIVKHAPDSFHQTDLDASLKAEGIDTLVVCGMMSHICIDTTVRTATNHGYNVILLHDACATRELEWQGKKLPAETVHAVFMASLGGFFAQAIATAGLKDVVK
jgi:nicotinamidase-related amidase